MRNGDAASIDNPPIEPGAVRCVRASGDRFGTDGFRGRSADRVDHAVVAGVAVAYVPVATPHAVAADPKRVQRAVCQLELEPHRLFPPFALPDARVDLRNLVLAGKITGLDKANVGIAEGNVARQGAEVPFPLEYPNPEAQREP